MVRARSWGTPVAAAQLADALNLKHCPPFCSRTRTPLRPARTPARAPESPPTLANCATAARDWSILLASMDSCLGLSPQVPQNPQPINPTRTRKTAQVDGEPGVCLDFQDLPLEAAHAHMGRHWQLPWRTCHFVHKPGSTLLNRGSLFGFGFECDLHTLRIGHS